MNDHPADPIAYPALPIECEMNGWVVNQTPDLQPLIDAISKQEMHSALRIMSDGSLFTEPEVHLPDVWHDDEHDIVIEDEQFTALTGHTAQYAYNGAVMHASEQFSASHLCELITHAQYRPKGVVFGLVIVNVLPTTDEPDPEPAGWAVLMRTPANT